MRTVLAILVLCSDNLAVQVPSNWGGSAVQYDQYIQAQPYPQKSAKQETPIPVEYFQYTAKKPQFATDIAQFHGVQNPQAHYTSYPVRPYIGVSIPQLGQHQIQNTNRPVFDQFQQFTQLNEPEQSYATPVKAYYDVFHPYEAEEPHLKEIYKDPVLDKIRNDIKDSQNRLQTYENEAGKENIDDAENLENPEETDRKKFPHKNVPTQFEVHRPQRRPSYYLFPPKFSREHVLNHKFRHPWNQHNAKIRPLHYQPLKNHLQRLRQHHATKFDDERNEYPQPPPPEAYSEPSEGYDIYERGKQKYVRLRNNVDESINNAIKENRPKVYQRLELQNNGDRTQTEIGDPEEDEFVPIKNYAQVRKTETIKHLPREAAFDDADSLDEIKNAPRLREAIKSTRAQTVYTEEGYEDAAYDHAGEQKHASEAEAHGGYLKEKELSKGKYKAPDLAAKYQDAGGNAQRDLTLHGEKWKNADSEEEKEKDSDDFSEDEIADYIEEDVYKQVNGDRNKRAHKPDETHDGEKPENEEGEDADEEQTPEAEYNDDDDKLKDDGASSENKTNSGEVVPHEVIKRETDVKEAPVEKQIENIKNVTNFKIPEINFDSTFLTEEELKQIAKFRLEPPNDGIEDKYPYYFKNLEKIHKDSPLRYAENLKLIPKKTKGGTEFYDSRSNFVCPEVDEKVDALPEKLKKKGHPDEPDDEHEEQTPRKKGEADFESQKDNPRLSGLGDKIDCFKAKYFGENPLDSPFFKEDIIPNPEPVTVPNLDTYKLKSKEILPLESQFSKIFETTGKLKDDTKSDVVALIEQLRNGQQILQDTLVKTDHGIRGSLIPQNFSIFGGTPAQIAQQTGVYSDILGNIETSLQRSAPITAHLKNSNNVTNKLIENSTVPFSGLLNSNKTITGESVDSSPKVQTNSNVSYVAYQNKEDITKPPLKLRKRRAAAFVYEPYKIIRDIQIPESKKTTTTGNVSPLIKQLQSSRVVDRVLKSEEKEPPVKRNVSMRTYKDIGKQDRVRSSKGSKPPDPIIVDVSVDPRRGEPRYEIYVKPTNHKSNYTPVENKKSISLEDYEAKINKTLSNIEDILKPKTDTTESLKTQPTDFPQTENPTSAPFYDVSQFLPKTTDMQTPSASNTVRKVIKSSTNAPDLKKKGLSKEDTQKFDDDDEEDYDEYEDEEEEITTTTTTTTFKPHFRRRKLRTTSTTEKPQEEVQELPKLRLVTRFRANADKLNNEYKTETSTVKSNPKLKPINDNDSPKYREKKRKTTESTLVTDTKSYGGDEDDELMKDEVDSMIGVKHDMDEYTPLYEKEERRREKEEENEDDEEEDDDDDDDEEIDDEYDEDSDEDDDEEEQEFTTTTEPPKRTLVKTTEAPISTTEARSAKLEVKPKVTRRKIEIHKDLPVNNSSPNSVTQFKQDIQEVEIIKEMPSNKPTKESFKRPQKNIEALELYKDENLPKEINKLGAVEVFKANLDLSHGPKHGGNYRHAPSAELIEEIESTNPPPMHGGNLKALKDAEASQSETNKAVEINKRDQRVRGRNARLRNSRLSAKLELTEPTDSETERSVRFMHGGNLKPIDRGQRGGTGRSAKLIELDENSEEDEDSPSMHGGNFKSYSSSRGSTSGRPRHGGSYRSAKLVQADDNSKESVKQDETTSVSPIQNARTNAAVLLNSFVQAVPILTTTPAYILDPSKRMYYYAEP